MGWERLPWLPCSCSGNSVAWPDTAGDIELGIGSVRGSCDIKARGAGARVDVALGRPASVHYSIEGASEVTTPDECEPSEQSANSTVVSGVIELLAVEAAASTGGGRGKVSAEGRSVFAFGMSPGGDNASGSGPRTIAVRANSGPVALTVAEGGGSPLDQLAAKLAKLGQAP